MNVTKDIKHILVIEDQKGRRLLLLDKPTYSIGRQSNSDIKLDDKFVSRHHATLLQIKKTPQAHRYVYRLIDGDLQGNSSTNGLIVNGRTCQEHDLKHGDVILFGSQAKASYYLFSHSEEISLADFERFNQLPAGDFRQKLLALDESRETAYTDCQQLTVLDYDDLLRLASFPELSPYPIIEIDFQGDITYLNPAASLKFNGIQQAKLEHPLLAGLLVASQYEGNKLLRREIKVGGRIFEQHVHYLPENRRIRSYLFDVTKRKQVEYKLKYWASHDQLTGLPNQAYFKDHLTRAVAQSKRYRHLLGIMFLDLDNFKNINDTLGHPAGDRLLQCFAQRLHSSLRASDILARWGGDEFTLLLPEIQSEEDPIALAQRIFEMLKQPFEIAGDLLYINTSIGIAIYPQDGENGETLIKNADAALYQAKEEGRNRYQFYSVTMTSKVFQRLKLENLLHQALTNEDFYLHYQPQVQAATGKISGIEALLRCSHPELKKIPLNELISFAEKTDLIVPLSQWVLRTACQQNKAWQQAQLQPIPIAVNFSPRQFQDPHLVDLVNQVLNETGLEPQWLEVEITETSIIQNIDIATQMLEKLKQMGVLLSLDDFGTGYSSLSYLKQFPFHTLKIDRSFILELSEDSQGIAIIKAIVALGKSFNLRVIAEGVETQQQLELLQRLECEEFQGYLFSRPLQAEDATQFLKQYSNYK